MDLAFRLPIADERTILDVNRSAKPRTRVSCVTTSTAGFCSLAMAYRIFIPAMPKPMMSFSRAFGEPTKYFHVSVV